MTGSDDGYNALPDLREYHGMECDCCSCEHERGNVTEEECEVQTPPVVSIMAEIRRALAAQKARVNRG